MRYSSKQYARALYESLKGANDTDLVFRNFYNLLVRNNDLKLLSKIIEKIEEIDKEERGVVEVKIAGVKKLEQEIIEKLRNLIKNAEIKEEIDPSLIGGLKIQIGDLLIDGSIKAKLNELRQRLI
jgi:F-type H+-transporting ATPase subunit delta